MFQAAPGFGIPNSCGRSLSYQALQQCPKGEVFRGSYPHVSHVEFCILHPSPTIAWYAGALLDIIERYIRPNQANLASLTSQRAGTTGVTLLEDFFVPQGDPVIRGSISSTSRDLNKIEPRLFGFSAIGYTDTIVQYSTCCGIFI